MEAKLAFTHRSLELKELDAAANTGRLRATPHFRLKLIAIPVIFLVAITAQAPHPALKIRRA
jgi:hypothetical protein